MLAFWVLHYGLLLYLLSKTGRASVLATLPPPHPNYRCMKGDGGVASQRETRVFALRGGQTSLLISMSGVPADGEGGKKLTWSSTDALSPGLPRTVSAGNVGAEESGL